MESIFFHQNKKGEISLPLQEPIYANYLGITLAIAASNVSNG